MKTLNSMITKNLVRRFLVTSALGFVTGAAVQAHEGGKGHSILAVHAYIPVEYHSIDPGELNKYMGVAELPQVRVPNVLAGIGTQVQLDRIVLNLSYARAGKRYNLDNAHMKAPFSTYGFNLGYDIGKHPFLNLQPYAGFRIGRIAYKYEHQIPRAAGIPGAPQPSTDEMQFRGTRGMIDLGVGASLQTKLLLGIRTGVLLPAGRTRWQDGDGMRLSGGPELSYRYYIGVNLGFGKANIKLKTSPPPASADAQENLSFVY